MPDVYAYDRLYDYPLADQVSIVDDIRTAAAELGALDLVAACDPIAARLRAALDLRERRWVALAPSPERRRAVELDRQIDRQVGAVYRALDAAAVSPVHPHAEAAARLRFEAFPQGLRAHVQAAWEEQRVRDAALVEQLRRPERAELVAALFLGGVADQIVSLGRERDLALRAAPRITGADVRAAERACGEHVRQLIHRILGRYAPDDPAQRAARDRLLATVLVHNARLRAEAMRGRREAAARRRQGGRAATLAVG